LDYIQHQEMIIISSMHSPF